MFSIKWVGSIENSARWCRSIAKFFAEQKIAGRDQMAQCGDDQNRETLPSADHQLLLAVKIRDYRRPTRRITEPISSGVARVKLFASGRAVFGSDRAFEDADLADFAFAGAFIGAGGTSTR